MSLGADFYAAKVAEYGDDCKTYGDGFEAAIKRGDIDEAKRCISRLKDRADEAGRFAEYAIEAA